MCVSLSLSRDIKKKPKFVCASSRVYDFFHFVDTLERFTATLNWNERVNMKMIFINSPLSCVCVCAHWIGCIRPVKEPLCTYSRTLLSVWWHCMWGGRSLGKHLQFNYCIPSPLLPFLTANLSFYTLVQFHGIEKDFSLLSLALAQFCV